MKKLIFSKYSNDRDNRYSIRTDILQDESGKRYVQKRPADREAVKHVSQLLHFYEELTDLYKDTSVSLNKCELQGQVAQFEYLTGETLEERLDRLHANKDREGFLKLFLSYTDLLWSVHQGESFAVTPAFEQVFGPADGLEGLACAPVSNVDVVVSNIIVNDVWNMIDYEWTFDFAIPAEFLVFRVVHYYLYSDSKRADIQQWNLFERCNINMDHIEIYNKMEEHFQNYLTGSHVPLRKFYEQMSPGELRVNEELQTREHKIQVLEDELLKKERVIGHYEGMIERMEDKNEGKNSIRFHIDAIKREGARVVAQGWAVDEINENKVEVLDEEGKPVKCHVDRFVRADVNAAELPEQPEYKSAFNIFFERKDVKTKRVQFKFSNKLESQTYVWNLWKQDIKMILHGGYRKKNEDGTVTYQEWRKQHLVTKKEMAMQRKHVFDVQPKFSIVIPLYNTPLNYLKEIIDSVLKQTYSNLELCLADGSDNTAVEEFIAKKYKNEKRIAYQHLKENKGISENTNAALAMATGDFIVLSDHDDVLELDALHMMANVVNGNSDVDVIYTDEDKVDMDGKLYFEPHFKPDFNLDMLRANNYICHIFCVRKSVVDKIGNFRSAFDGAQDLDFILRCCEQARRIEHIPKVLYHWRCHPNSTASNPDSKMYAFEAGRKALEEHYKRVGLDAKVSLTELFGRYRTVFPVLGMPLVSIIIPNKDHIEDLEKCLNSIYEKTIYRNYEILVVENNSTEEETFTYYKKIEKKYENLRVITWKDEFNYAAINNYAVKSANGEYLLFLNNDVEIITPDWMNEMLGYAQREDVGIVGAKLLYPDTTIQHAGVIIGLGGIAGHIFTGYGGKDYLYQARAVTTQDYSAVTAACMMVPKAVFEEVEGFDEGYKVAFNDVDFCMKVRETGRLVVFNAYVQLYHYESKSRGAEETEEQLNRFNDEVNRFRKKWPDILQNGDPYYNVNLSLKGGNCALR